MVRIREYSCMAHVPETNPTDNELIAQHRAGDTAAFPALVERYLSSIFRFVTRLVGDARAAEDLTQETFLKARLSFSKYKSTFSFKSWLFSIARNTAIDHLRKRQHIPFSALDREDEPAFAEGIVDPLPLPDAQLEQQELGTILTQTLEQLTPASRSVVLLHDAEDLTFEDIAQITKEPMNTVKSRYRRAVLALRDLLQHVRP